MQFLLLRLSYAPCLTIACELVSHHTALTNTILHDVYYTLCYAVLLYNSHKRLIPLLDGHAGLRYCGLLAMMTKRLVLQHLFEAVPC
jgi:hypothetical protein